MCLKDLRNEFLYDCECRHLAKGSLRNYRAATRFLVDFLELRRITELEEVKPHHIRDLMKEKQDMGSTPRYINDLLKVWRTWFNYLVTEGYLDERDNPAKKVKPLRQPKTIIDTFTVDKMRRMIRFYDGTDFLSVRNKTIIMLLFDTGMRCNEMILMEPEDIKPDYILVKHGKGSKERVVPKSPALSKQLMKYRTLRDGPLQRAFLKGCNGHFAQNRKKILVQCVRIMRIGGFFYTVPQGMQPYLGQCFKGQVSSIQDVKVRLGFPLNQHPFDLHIGRSVNVTPLDLPLRCARFDVPAFPPTVLTLANVFSPSRHRCFLLLFRPSSDPLFSQSSFTAGIIIQNWA